MISFRRKAEWLGPGRFALQYDGEIINADLQQLLEPGRWSLKRFDATGAQWLLVDAAEKLEALRAEPELRRLELRLCALDGLYRLQLAAAHPALKSGCDFFYIRESRASREPYHLYLEGHGEIDYLYLDQDSLPQGISQKFDFREGIAVCGGLSFVLVDTDGDISRIFAPRNAETVALLKRRLSADDVEALLEGGDALPASGSLWLDRELVEYSSHSGDLLHISRRGAKRTRATTHEAGTPLRAGAPHLHGRAVYIERADGGRHYGGIIERVSPFSDNQSCYRVELTDALSALDVDIGRNLGSAEVAPLYMIHGAAARFRLRWVDALAIGGFKPSEEGATVTLKPGIYDITPGRSGARHLCSELERAIRAADTICDERFVSAAINEDGELQLTFKGSYRVDLLPAESSSVLTQLGYTASGLSISDDEAWTGGDAQQGMFTFAGSTALADLLLSAASDIILLADDSGGRTPCPDGGLVRIGDELVAYGAMLEMQRARTGLLAENLSASADGDSVVLQDANGFYAGQVVLIDDEQIVLGPRWGGTFNECVRGAGGSDIAAHYEGAQVSLPSVNMMLACRRGMYGSVAGTHGAGEEVEELLCSDNLSRTAEPVICAPREFMAALLGCGNAAHLRRYSLDLPDELLDVNAFGETASGRDGAANTSFLAIIGRGVSYRDALAKTALCLGGGLYIDSRARISLGSFAARLDHDTAGVCIDASDWIGPPALSWCEDGRINRVCVTLDRDPLEDEHRRRIIINDTLEDTRELFRSSEHSLEIKADYFYSGESACRKGAADMMFIGLARRCFTWFNRFYTAVEGRLPLLRYAGLGLFDSVRISLPQCAGGDGARGISNVVYDVVEIEPDLSDMSLRVVLIERSDERYGGLNIGVDVAGWQEAAGTLTLARMEHWPEGLTPSQLLKSGDRVRIKRRSDGLSTYSQAIEVAEVEEHWRNVGGLYCASLKLAETPLVTPRIGDLLVSAHYGAHVSDDSVIRRLIHAAADDGSLGDDEPFVYSY